MKVLFFSWMPYIHSTQVIHFNNKIMYPIKKDRTIYIVRPYILLAIPVSL